MSVVRPGNEGTAADVLSRRTSPTNCLVMKYVERIHSKHTPAQLFDLVADVEQYPNFIPWVISARVTGRKDNTMWTDMTMGTGFLRKQFTTVASLDRPRRMEISSHDPIFEKFEQIWTFDPAADGGTDVECGVELSVRSPILKVAVGLSRRGKHESNGEGLYATGTAIVWNAAIVVHRTTRLNRVNVCDSVRDRK